MLLICDGELDLSRECELIKEEIKAVRSFKVFDEEEKTVFRLEDPVFYVVESSSQQSAKERQI